MKQLLHILFILLFALAPCVCMRAQSICETAPLVTQSFSTQVPMAGYYWFSAWTYDLPLNIVFTPSQPISTAPMAQLDFRCGKGAYPTEELENFFNPKQQGDIAVDLGMPRTYTFSRKATGEYYFAIPRTYRDMMFRAGLTEDVQAYVRVYFPAPGDINLQPTEEFRACVEVDTWTSYNDTINVSANDEASYYIFPYSLWKNDSIRFIWTGAEPVVLWFGKDCNFLPDPADEYFLDYLVLDPEVSNEYKLSQEELVYFIDTYREVVMDGLFYVRIVSEQEGKFVVERISSVLDPEDPEPEVIPDPIYPETPEPEWTGTIRLACEEENVMRVEVSAEQTLSLYEVRDHNATTPRPVLTLVEQWTQAPIDTPHVLTLETEHTYMLKGMDATIRIRR